MTCVYHDQGFCPTYPIQNSKVRTEAQYLPVLLPPSSGSPTAGALTYLLPLLLDNSVKPMDPFSEY